MSVLGLIALVKFGYPRLWEGFREHVAITPSVTGLRVPEIYGGVGGSYVMAGIAAEEIARGDHNFTMYLQLGAISADLIGQYAEERVKLKILPGIASGETLVSFGLTEPGAGSDAASIKTRATLDGDEWVVNGEKASITMAGYADYCVVFARVGAAGAKGAAPAGAGAFSRPTMAATMVKGDPIGKGMAVSTPTIMPLPIAAPHESP